MNHCCVISCLNYRRDRRFKFFTFPSDPDRCAQWVEFCHHPTISERLITSGPYSLVKYAICSEHFDPSIVADFLRRKIPLPANTVPDRIGKTFMTRKMLLDRGFDLENEPVSPQTFQVNFPPPVDDVLVEMLDPAEVDRENDEQNFEFIRLKSDDQKFEFEDGFKQEFVEAGGSQEAQCIPTASEQHTIAPKKGCKTCSNFEPRYENQVKKNKHLECLIDKKKKQLADLTTNLQKMHDRLTLRKMRRIELKKKYAELKKQRGKGTMDLAELNAAESEDDDGSFDETAAWW